MAKKNANRPSRQTREAATVAMVVLGLCDPNRDPIIKAKGLLLAALSLAEVAGVPEKDVLITVKEFWMANRP